MRNKSWIAMITLPLALAALGSTADAQGKSKAQGREKAEQGKGQGNGKKEKAPIARPAAQGASAEQKRGPSEKGSQARSENRPTASTNAGSVFFH